MILNILSYLIGSIDNNDVFHHWQGQTIEDIFGFHLLNNVEKVKYVQFQEYESDR